MVGESKILTVSYGTFSCTLEGFDEPFSTMKAIAEYFRDLAADDRYFGAEPPQPDTEMLHQIAERTIQRRVAAELAENGVILRQETPAETAAPAAPALAVEVAKADAPIQETPAPTASVMESVSNVPPAPQPTPVRAAEIAQPVVETKAPSQGGGDTVAEKLQRIRAVVAREAATPAPYSEDQHAEEFGSDSFEDEAPKATALFDTPIDAGYGDFDDEIENSVEEVAAAQDDTIELVAEESPAEDIAEEAQPDVVETDAQSEAEVAAVEAEEVTTEAEPAPEEDTSEKAESVEAASEEVDAPVADEVKVEDILEDVATEVTEEEKAADVASEADAIDAALTEDETEAQAQSSLRTKPRRRIVVQKISRSEMEAAKAAKEAELPPELEAELMAELAEVEAEADAIDMTSDADEAVDAVSETSEETVEDTSVEATSEVEADDADAMLARLAADTAPEDVVAEPVEDVAEEIASDSDDVLSKMLSDSAADSAQETVDDTPSAEELSETATDTAEEAVEEMASETVMDVDEAETTSEEKEGKAAKAEDTDQSEEADAPSRKSFAAEAENDAIERLMSTTSSRLDNDESSVRRASIAHLKAAVAATKADATIAEANEKRDEEELGQYRDDLARVVRPQRPTSGGGRGERPAPLVLVSEQRIDRPEEAVQEAAASIDVRPRRVTRGNLALQEEMEEQFTEDENVFADSETKISFPEYAAKAGALELPDLLEAAAGHYVVVEGAEHFTRPMLMRKLALISGPEAPSREDGLRAFGTLLRTGKIVKSDNGKFVLSQGSQFAQEAL